MIDRKITTLNAAHYPKMKQTNCRRVRYTIASFFRHKVICPPAGWASSVALWYVETATKAPTKNGNKIVTNSFRSSNTPFIPNKGGLTGRIKYAVVTQDPAMIATALYLHLSA